MLKRQEFYIDGQWTDPVRANDLAVVNPATEQDCAIISCGTKADVDLAVAAGRRALPQWSALESGQRIEMVETLFEIYKSRSDEMAELISMEMGAPISLAKQAQSPAGLSHIKSFLRAMKTFKFEEKYEGRIDHQQIIRQPIGVCGLITPWNWPMNQVTLKVIPALLTGCTMVLKPSEIAPLSSLLFADFIHEAGFPKGVFNLVNGTGAEVGAALSRHADVDMISFTGSTRAGIAITKDAADTVKRVSLELGGKGANIIFADADDKAVKRGVLQCFQNTGQSCNAPTRMLIERSAYAAAVRQVEEVASAVQVGVPGEEGRQLGPVVSYDQFEKVQRLIKTGIEDGATLLAGGLGKPDGCQTGYYVRPTVFSDVTGEMVIAQEEIFGPVLVIMPFENEAEAIRIANDTLFGLTNYVQSADPDKAARVARALQSGMVEINGQMLEAGTPFGGMRQSGNGREGGAWGLEEFLETKVVSGWASS